MTHVRSSRLRLLGMGIGLVAGGSAAAVAGESPPKILLPSQAGQPPQAAIERRLHLATAEASSFLVNDWNRFQENYLPLYVGDDDPKTAWTEGAKGDGVGEWLRLKVTPMAGATRVRLRIRNGYQKSDRLFAANERARGVTVVLLPSGAKVDELALEIPLSDAKVDAELADRQDWQEVIVTQPAGALAAVELRVRSVYAGKKYDDLCISDAQLLVTATTPENPAFEKARFAQLTKWKTERVAAAKLFRSALGKKLPFAPQYRATESLRPNLPEKADKPCANGDGLCRLRQQLTRSQRFAAAEKVDLAPYRRALAAVDGIAAFAPVQVVSRDRRAIPQVDATCAPSILGCDSDPCYMAMPLPATATVGFMNAATLSTLEIKNPPTIEDVEALIPKECTMLGVK